MQQPPLQLEGDAKAETRQWIPEISKRGFIIPTKQDLSLWGGVILVGGGVEVG